MADNPDTADLDEAHGFAEHYDQHVWLYRDNPNGVLEPFNPNATCEHHTERTLTISANWRRRTPGAVRISPAAAWQHETNTPRNRRIQD